MTATATPARPFVAVDAEVVAVERLSENFRRIVFGGDGMAAFGPERDPLDLRIKLLIPNDGATTPPMLDVATDDWYQQWLAADPDSRGQMRTYTVRSVDDDGGRRSVTVDFVLHADADGHSGPAARWAQHARPGDRLCLLGPNRAVARPGGIEFDPGRARRLLLVADETAVPAVASILASRPQQQGDVFLEVPSDDDILDLPSAPGIEVNWLVRGDAPHGERLIGAVRHALGLTCAHRECGADCRLLDLVIDRITPRPDRLSGPPFVRPGAGADEPAETMVWETPQYSASGERIDASGTGTQAGTPEPEPLYAWIAGESSMVKHLRRCMVRELGLPRQQVAFMGYWRLGAAHE